MNRSKMLRKLAKTAAERVPIPPDKRTGRIDPRARAAATALLYQAARKVWGRLTTAERTRLGTQSVLGTALVLELVSPETKSIRRAATIAEAVLERLRS